MADRNDLGWLYAARNHYFVTQWLGVREDYADGRSREGSVACERYRKNDRR